MNKTHKIHKLAPLRLAIALMLIGCTTPVPSLFPSNQNHENGSQTLKSNNNIGMTDAQNTQAEADYYRELKEKFNNRTPYTGDVKVLINTGMLPNNGASPKEIDLSQIIQNSGFQIQSLPAGTIAFQQTFSNRSSRNDDSEETVEVKIPDSTKYYTLHLQNGDASGKNKVNSAEININGYEWLKESDFNNQIKEINIPSMMLNSYNSLRVKIKGKSGSQFTLTLVEAGQVGTIRRRSDLENDHSSQADHIKANDKTIFYPNLPDSLGTLSPFEGDISITVGNGGTLDNAHISAFQKNGHALQFELGKLIIETSLSETELQAILAPYHAEVTGRIEGFYLVKLDLAASPLQKAEALISEANTAFLEPFRDIKFSSLASFQQFILMLDLGKNHADTFRSIEYNVLNGSSRSLPQTFPVLTNDALPLQNQAWLITSGVLNAWNLSIGTGANIAIVDGSVPRPNHKEIKRRVLRERQDNSTVTECNFWDLTCGFFGNRKEDITIYHQHYAAMMAAGERDNGFGNAGVAPNSEVIFYNATTPWDVAIAMEKARSNGADVIVFPSGYDGVGIDFAKWGENIVSFTSGQRNLGKTITTTTDIWNVPVVASASDYDIDEKDDWYKNYPGLLTKMIVVGSSYYDQPAQRWRLAVRSLNTDRGPLGLPLKPEFLGTGRGPNLLFAPGEASTGGRFAPFRLSRSDAVNPTDSGAFAGTSAAAPYVAGVVALMKSRNPSMSAGAIREILFQTARHDLYDNNGTTTLPSYNRVDPLEAVAKTIEKQVSYPQPVSDNPIDYIAQDIVGKLERNSDGTWDIVGNSRFQANTVSPRLRLTQTISTEKWLELPNLRNNLVKLKGWTGSSILAGKNEVNPIPNTTLNFLTGKVEILQHELFGDNPPIIDSNGSFNPGEWPFITGIAPFAGSTFKFSRGNEFSLTIEGKNMFVLNKPLELVFAKPQDQADPSKYIVIPMNFDSSNEYLDNNGKMAKFHLVSSETSVIPLGSYHVAVRADNRMSGFSIGAIEVEAAGSSPSPSPSSSSSAPPSQCETDEIVTNPNWIWFKNGSERTPVVLVPAYDDLSHIKISSDPLRVRNPYQADNRVHAIWSEIYPPGGPNAGTAICGPCSYDFWFDYSLPSGYHVTASKIQIQSDDQADIFVNSNYIGSATYASTFGSGTYQEFTVPPSAFQSGGNTLGLTFTLRGANGNQQPFPQFNFAAVAGKMEIQRCPNTGPSGSPSPGPSGSPSPRPSGGGTV